MHTPGTDTIAVMAWHSTPTLSTADGCREVLSRLQHTLKTAKHSAHSTP